MRKKPLGIATVSVNGVFALTVQPKVNEFGVSERGRSIQHWVFYVECSYIKPYWGDSGSYFTGWYSPSFAFHSQPMPVGSRLRVQLINSLVVSFSRDGARLDGLKPSRGARFSGGNASSSTWGCWLNKAFLQ
ncbi:MAG: hypothetical protein V7K18_19905 [Nostoc sp.]|uniref:hypothetical protein n=1 Tax=Nostoc sp. TaxID=1180 RepID=UPI002FF508E8